MGQVKDSYINEKYTPLKKLEKPENSRYVSYSQFQNIIIWKILLLMLTQIRMLQTWAWIMIAIVQVQRLLAKIT